MSYLEITIRIFCSLLAGGLIGLERESKHRPAGFKTHMLVSLGAATIMVLSRLMYTRYQTEAGFLIDPTRMAAQIVSGIGFLGAGTIIHYGVNVRGLTTAASLWATATLGMVIGSGFYFLAFVVFASMFITLIIFSKLQEKCKITQTTLNYL